MLGERETAEIKKKLKKKKRKTFFFENFFDFYEKFRFIHLFFREKR